LRKAGKNVQVDFSESGGDPKKFVAYADLSCAAAAASPSEGEKEQEKPPEVVVAEHEQKPDADHSPQTEAGEVDDENADGGAEASDKQDDDSDDGASTGTVLEKTMVQQGLAVWLTTDPKQRGIILRKAGKNVQVDFSESGGDPKKFVAYADLSCAAAAASSTPRGDADTAQQEHPATAAGPNDGKDDATIAADPRLDGNPEAEFDLEEDTESEKQPEQDEDQDEQKQQHNKDKDEDESKKVVNDATSEGNQRDEPESEPDKEEDDTAVATLEAEVVAEAEALAMAMLPPKEYSVKLKGKGKCQVKVSAMGLIVADKKGLNSTTYLYETMEGWESNGEQFSVKPSGDKNAMVFECSADVAAVITDAMTRHAQALAETMKAKRKAEKLAKKEAAAAAAAASTDENHDADATSASDVGGGDAAATGVVLEKEMVKKGLAVWLTKDPSKRGVILTKAGRNVKVDFSESGGDPKKFVAYSDLSCSA
jgi:hypothetical protein